MTTDYTNRIVLILMIILFFAHSGGGGPAPFKAEGLVVLCLEDKTYEGHAALTPEQDDIMRAQDDTSFRKYILDNGGDFQVVDLSQSVDDDAPWVKAAVEAAKGLDQSKFPWVLCASPRGGFSMAIPPDAKPEEFHKEGPAVGGGQEVGICGTRAGCRCGRVVHEPGQSAIPHFHPRPGLVTLCR
jgi:hypothetical protein